MHDNSTLFRYLGVVLAIVFHVFMFALAFTSENALAGGYRFLFTWYMPSIILGLPWSIAALFGSAFVPGLEIIGLVVAVCINAYLLGWVIDAIVDIVRHGRGRNDRARRARQYGTSPCVDALTINQLLASEAAMADPHARSSPGASS